MNPDYGYFDSEPGCYCITRKNVPTSWDYLYKNERLLMLVDQNGPVKAQIDPPSGIVVFRREAQQNCSPWLVWMSSPQFKDGAFTNFFRPSMSGQNPAIEPDAYQTRYTPYQAVYTLTNQGVKTTTTFTIHPGKPAIVMRFSIESQHSKPISVNVFPTLRLYANPAQLAPWDQPEWYLKTSFFKHRKYGFLTQLMNMNAQPNKRAYFVTAFSSEAIAGSEVYCEKFIGQGAFENPQSIHDNNLTVSPGSALPFGTLDAHNSACCFPQINAVHYPVSLQPGQAWSFTQVVSLLPNGPEGTLPGSAELEEALRLTEDTEFTQCINTQKKRYERLVTHRSIRTGLSDFDNYVNHWLPLQQDWICSLDRGWPSGMRGSRDSANDFTAMVPLDASASANAILLLMECQRSDGWFPRQYSALGRTGKHDLRGHVDAGCWVIELLYEYLCWTKDFDLLKKEVLWLDSETPSSVLEHAIRALEYFITPANLGEHGLCKIGEGDWNDAVNLAGLKGRGESVMVSGQTVIALTQFSEVLSHLKTSGFKTGINLSALLDQYQKAKQDLTENLRKHAFNSDGYFNSVFNDDGRWIFSPTDPDGRRRVSGPANWYAIASGVADAKMTQSILRQLDYLKCSEGYRLFYPPFDSKPIPTVGRISTGDQPVGVFENGTAYNQGSHGFLARALTAANQGDLLFDAIQYMLPYNQDIHPVSRTLTAPYAVVNTWLLVPGYEGRGGRTFLTGTISMALRAVYSWMLGIQPTLTGILIDPCMPRHLKTVRASFEYQGKTFELEIDNRQSGTLEVHLDSQKVTNTAVHPFSRRTAVEISDALLSRSTHRQIKVITP